MARTNPEVQADWTTQKARICSHPELTKEHEKNNEPTLNHEMPLA